MVYNRTKLEIAQEYIALGFKLFPVHTLEDGKCSCGNADCKDVAKHPITVHGVKDATDDPAKLRDCFTGAYEIANIGLATGSPSNVFVVDVDNIDSFVGLQSNNEPLPRTWEAKTGSGGKHLYFRNPQNVNVKNSRSKLAPGIDVRGEGGYVILPPSVHATGQRYEWINAPDKVTLADAPAWLLALVTGEDRQSKTVNETLTVHDGPSNRQRAIAYLQSCPPAISGEGGHPRTFGVVCRLLELYPSLSDDDLLDVLSDWNERCEPPWNERELRHKVTSARQRVGVDEDEEWNVEIVDAIEDIDEDEDDEAEEWPTLHADAFHGLAGKIVRRIEPHTEADPVALLVTFLNAFGCIVGRSPNVTINTNTKHFANTFFCVVGQSSRSRKGTSLDDILNVLSGIDETFDGRINGLSTGEGIVNRLRDAEDGTPTDKRLWVVESEFAQALRVMKRTENTLSPVIRNLWDRGEVSILTRQNPLKANGCHVSILGHITQEELCKSLDSVDVFNGFANRFLWALSRRSKLLPLGGGTVDVDDLRKRLSVVTQKTKHLTTLEFAPEAKLLYRQRYASLGDGRRGLWDAVCSRAEPQVIRLAMLYALLDGVATIDVPHLKAALALWDYCDDSARLIFGEAEGDTLERKILDVIRSRPGITKTELRNAISGKLKAKERDSALDWLERRGRIEIVSVVENRRRFDRLFASGVSRSVGHQDDGGKRPTDLLTPAQDEGGDGKRPTDPMTPPVEASTLTQLLDWRNVNSAEFVKNDSGLVWVTNEDRLTPSLKVALETHQKTLQTFVADTDDSRALTEDEFFDSLDEDGKAFVKELMTL